MPGSESRTVRIALVGDRSDRVRAHAAIPTALRLAAAAATCRVEACWVGTGEVGPHPERRLHDCDGIWCVPGSPYADMDGALGAIRFARESRRPFLGTCAGFQHALIEYARNVLGMPLADHAESSPDAPLQLIAALACPLVDVSDVVVLRRGSRLAAIYGRTEAMEGYHCRFSLDPRHEPLLDDGSLQVAARDRDGAVRAVELRAHPFYVATQFQPELAALDGVAHPLVDAYVRAAVEAARDPEAESD